MEFQKIEYTTKSKINMKAIKSFKTKGLRESFEQIEKFKPLILRIRIDDNNLIHIEDFDTITLQNIRRVAEYKLTKEFSKSVEGERIMAKTLRIEIYKSPWKKDAWCIRTGDITGSTECSNISKEELFKEIENGMNEIDDEKSESSEVQE